MKRAPAVTETTNAIDIHAPAATIYALAAATERWPEILPHYRSVRVLATTGATPTTGATRTLSMKAMRDAIPIAWVAEQTDDPETPAIRFHHVRGWTRGMDVVWRFEPIPGGTRVTIEHRLAFRFPVAAAWLGEHVVGGFFVHDVAGKTLARIKALAEASA